MVIRTRTIGVNKVEIKSGDTVFADGYLGPVEPEFSSSSSSSSESSSSTDSSSSSESTEVMTSSSSSSGG